MREKIIAHRHSFTMNSVCKWFEHSKSGYYTHRQVVEKQLELEKEVISYIRIIRSSGIMCGARKMKVYLMKLFNFKIGRDKLLSIMRKHNLLCQYYKQRVRTSNGKKSNYPNLL